MTLDTNFNLFGLIKKCAIKLSLDVPTAFTEVADDEELTKILDCLNVINRTIVLSEVDRWSFRDLESEITLVAGQEEYDRVNGMITNIRYQYTDGNGNLTLSQPLIPEYRWNYLNSSEGQPERYNLYGDKLLLYPTPTSAEAGNKLIVKYATNNCAKSSTGVLQPNMVATGDFSLIPTQFSDVLIYGACLDYKAMPDKAKYQHYQQMYQQTLKTMRKQMKRSQELETYNEYGSSETGDDWVSNFFNSWRNP